jgi:hypothetical protein
MLTDLEPGTRVRLIARVARRSRFKTRTGVVRGRTRGNGYYVLLDGNKTTSRLHRSYLEIEREHAPGPMTVSTD